MSKPKAPPLVSVVIVNWNGLQDTKLCLERTRLQTYKNIEIIVVDNGSSDGSLSFLEKQQDIKLIKNSRNLGFTGGHIAGYNASHGEYILLLNNDAIMEESYIEKALNYMQSEDNIGAVGGKAYFWDENNPLYDTTNDFYAYQNINPLTAEGIFTRTDESFPREVNNISGSCVLVSKSAIDKVGYLHKPFFAYYEESDLFARMKRAGYKVVYHPDLAIWHANGKSAKRKGSTFSYYMMMRNRFRFAVRNFDSWALLRFIKFYIKMGVVSTAKSLLPASRYAVDRAYARAFWFNVFTCMSVFNERRRLSRNYALEFNYNERIVREQTILSVVVYCTTKKMVDECISNAKILNAWDEMIIVAKDENIIKYTKRFCDIDTSPVRICIDREFFSTHPDNLGIVSAKGEWILLSVDGKSIDFTKEDSEVYSALIYKARQQRKKFIYAADINKPLTLHQVSKFKYLSQVLIKSTFCRDIGGFAGSVSRIDAARAMVGFSIAESQALLYRRISSVAIPEYNKNAKESFDNLISMMRNTARDAASARRKPRVFDRLLSRYYRLQQLYYLGVWLISLKIPLRLKAGRCKNVAVSMLFLRKQSLAVELKHMRNEVLRSRNGIIDLVVRKNKEKQRLRYLQKHPDQTVVFIITRDRLQPLVQLVSWLESQNIKRIVFIDNDSALPPLKDFLRSTEYQVIETCQNIGHTVPWSQGIIKTLLPDDFYVVSDPDVIPINNEPGVLSYLYAIHEKYPNHMKVGFGLKINDIPDGYVLKQEVIRWEKQFWKHSPEPGIYEASVDTTFALYKPFTFNYFLHPSLRTDEPYTARHLPWYNTNDKLSDEDIFYRIRADQNVNTWDKGALPERYARELRRQRH